MQESGQHREIGFVDLFKIIFKRFFVILIAMVVAGVGALYAYSKNKNVNYYGATAHYKIYVSSVISSAPENESGSNYLYKEEHLSMLVDDLTSDTFVRDNIVQHLEDAPSYRADAPEEEADKFYTYLQAVKSCIQYSYDYTRNPNAIQVSVTVLNNKDFAQKLLNQVKVAVPAYIEEHMIKPAPEAFVVSGSSGAIIQRIYTTHCDETSMSRIRLINGGQMQSAVLKYAVLAAFIAAIVACVVVVVLDYTDTRVRDPEEFATRSDLPLLGTLPKSVLPETEVKA